MNDRPKPQDQGTPGPTPADSSGRVPASAPKAARPSLKPGLAPELASRAAMEATLAAWRWDHRHFAREGIPIPAQTAPPAIQAKPAA